MLCKFKNMCWIFKKWDMCITNAQLSFTELQTLNFLTGIARSTCEVAEIQLLPHGQHAAIFHRDDKWFQWEELRCLCLHFS